jgi:hypothetical protein
MCEEHQAEIQDLVIFLCKIAKLTILGWRSKGLEKDHQIEPNGA